MQPFDTRLSVRLANDGWMHLPGAGVAGLNHLIGELGVAVLNTTKVVVGEGRALVNSDRAIDFHTDHHRAELVAWHCLAQTSRGGHTRLSDGEAAFASLSREHRERLARVHVFEHSVFQGDAGTHPVVELREGRPRLYCSFWFEAPPDPADNAALTALHGAVARHEVANFRLAPGDVLVVDNRRILHARTAITGSRNRHLIRHWLASRT